MGNSSRYELAGSRGRGPVRRLRASAGLRRALRAAAEEGPRLGLLPFAVGGCVRDWLLGAEVKDLDVVVEGDPAPLARLCAARLGGQVETFDRFGTLRALAPGGLRVDFVRARAETYPAPAALPVVEPSTLRADLARRDFTINAMAAAIGPTGFGEVVDPFGGRADLAAGLVRVLHAASFEDDPTRLFRAARFATRLGFRLERSTAAAFRLAVRGGGPARLSRERLRNELARVLEESDPVPALVRLRSSGLARSLDPRLAWPKGLSKGPAPAERLGLIALAMGPERGASFVRSLHLERAESLALLEALETARTRASPRVELAPLARRVLELALGGLPSAALEPVLLGGDDLKAAGVVPGPAYRRRLEAAARAQWRGRFSNKAAALRWLRARL